MNELPRTTREAITGPIHAVCWDRNLDPFSLTDTEAGCRMERLLPELIRLAKVIGPDEFPRFEAAVPLTICLQCGQQRALGTCPVREQAECCVYRYLPLLYDAIHRVLGAEHEPHGIYHKEN